MLVANLVECLEYPQYGWLGLVMELEPDTSGTPGFWVEWFEQRGDWVWYPYRHHEYGKDVRVISEAR